VRPKARTDSSSRCAVTIRNSITKRCLYDLGGRRFNRADPGRSLMLTKPTQQVAHGGGLRFEINSDYYKIIYNWIAQGVPYGDPAKDSVKSLDVEPKEIFMDQPGGTTTVKIVATFNDGGTRDVTKRSEYR
jgi:hypothetical protein